ncbi:MAG: MBL fold metallo-hydrolase, partial [Phycisphaerae bacterium]
MAGAANMTWLGHATIRLTLPDERVILIDPWLRDNPSCPDQFKDPARCDFLALTHGHFDHTGDVARLIERHNPQVVATVELCSLLGL